jgi:hypothetical protein
MNPTRALYALAGAAFVAAGMYGFGLVLYTGQMAEGFTVWDAVSREITIVSILVAAALASPGRRGLRLLWLLAGALWIWLLVLPPISTADGGPPGVPLLFRFQSWSGITIPLFLLTLVHWRTTYRSLRDLRTPAGLLAVWAGAFAVCARYDWINTDVIWPGVDYSRVALLCWIFLAAPPLFLVRWILRRDREIHPESTRAEDLFWSRTAPRVRTPWSAAAAGIGIAAAGFVLISIYQGESGTFAVWMVLVCSLLTGPWLGRALRRHTADIPAPVLVAAQPIHPITGP